MHARSRSTCPRRRRRVGTATSIALAGGLAVAAATAAPAGAATSTPALRAVKRAGRATAKAGSATFSLSESLAAKGTHGSKASATVTGTGKADFTGHRFEMTLDMPDGQAVRVIEAAQVLYEKVPPASVSKVPGQKPWVSVTLSQLEHGSSSAVGAQLDSANSAGPSQALRELSEATSHGTKVGTQQIDGKKTTRYRVAVNLSKLAKKEPRNSQAIRREERALGKRDLPMDVWVGPQHRIRQIRIDLGVPRTPSSNASGSRAKGSAGATRSAGTAEATLTFTHFGTPVQVSAPPSSQVANITPQATGGAAPTGTGSSATSS